MKNFYFPLLLILSFSFCAAQELTGKFQYKATYKLTFQPNKNNPNNLNTEEMYLYLVMVFQNLEVLER